MTSWAGAVCLSVPEWSLAAVEADGGDGGWPRKKINSTTLYVAMTKTKLDIKSKYLKYFMENGRE